MVGCISPVCVLASFAMDGKLLLIVCLALLGTVQGYTLRDILRERGQNCLITVPVIAQTFQIDRQGHSVKILNSVFSNLTRFTVTKPANLGRTPNLKSRNENLFEQNRSYFCSFNQSCLTKKKLRDLFLPLLSYYGTW